MSSRLPGKYLPFVISDIRTFFVISRFTIKSTCYSIS
jgi:hypothetical protein